MDTPDYDERLSALEHKLAQQDEQLARQARELAHLQHWQQGHLFSYLAKQCPKSQSVIFLHADSFSDNVKYAYLGFLNIAEKHGVACRFLINNDEQRGLLEAAGLPVLPALAHWTLDHLRLVMSAKVLVTCDHLDPFLWNPPLPYFLLQGARLIQIWHGIPVQDVGFLNTDTPQAPLTGLKLASTGPADVFVAPGRSMQSQWREWFSFRRFAALGYPRTDVLLRPPSPRELINVDEAALHDIRLAREGGRGTIFYAPTIDDKRGLAGLDQIDLAGLATWCQKKGYFFMVKLQAAEGVAFEDFKRKLPDVRFARPESDLYPLLRHADLLVTDYSSLALDFLLLDRPIIFFWPDQTAYEKQYRNLLPGAERLMAGERVNSLEELKDALDDTITSGAEAYAETRRKISRELFDHPEGDASDRVALLILEQLNTDEQLPMGWGL